MRNHMWIGLVMLFVLSASLGVSQSQQKRALLYAPVEADFRPEYNRDSANKTRQSWKEYFDWVRSFYAGSFFAAGWTAQEKSVVASVMPASAQPKVQEMLNVLGKKIAKEWAKDNGIRKINTADLAHWGGMLTAPNSKNMGSVDKIKQTIADINNQVDKKLGDVRTQNIP